MRTSWYVTVRGGHDGNKIGEERVIRKFMTRERVRHCPSIKQIVIGLEGHYPVLNASFPPKADAAGTANDTVSGLIDYDMRVRVDGGLRRGIRDDADDSPTKRLMASSWRIVVVVARAVHVYITITVPVVLGLGVRPR